MVALLYACVRVCVCVYRFWCCAFARVVLKKYRGLLVSFVFDPPSEPRIQKMLFNASVTRSHADFHHIHHHMCATTQVFPKGSHSSGIRVFWVFQVLSIEGRMYTVPDHSQNRGISQVGFLPSCSHVHTYFAASSSPPPHRREIVASITHTTYITSFSCPHHLYSGTHFGFLQCCSKVMRRR